MLDVGRLEHMLLGAVMEGRYPVVYTLLQAGIRPHKTTPTFGRADSMLHLAVRGGFLDCLKVLLSHGAKPNVINNEKETALHLAASRNDVAMVRVLLSNGAHIRHVNRKGLTAEQIAAGLGKKSGKQIINLLRACASKLDDLNLQRRRQLEVCLGNITNLRL